MPLLCLAWCPEWDLFATFERQAQQKWSECAEFRYWEQTNGECVVFLAPNQPSWHPERTTKFNMSEKTLMLSSGLAGIRRTIGLHDLSWWTTGPIIIQHNLHLDFFKVIFYPFYHGKPPWSYHVGMFFIPTTEQADQSSWNITFTIDILSSANDGSFGVGNHWHMNWWFSSCCSPSIVQDETRGEGRHLWNLWCVRGGWMSRNHHFRGFFSCESPGLGGSMLL